MNIVSIPIKYCNKGDILAEDVDNENGITLVTKNTVMNEYIRCKLEDIGISCVWIYQSTQLHGKGLKEKKHIRIKRSYKKTIIMARKFLLELSSGGTINCSNVNKLVNTIFENINERTIIIQSLAEIKDADEYTYTHCVNVALYSMLIAKWLDFPETIIKEVILAGLLHDIGKIKVPGEILNKKEKLTSEEFDLIKKHPEYGYEMVKAKPEIKDSISLAVRQHHERMDGSGYPDGLTGNCIGVYGKIISIADVYDAMTQNRVYKEGVTPFESFRMFLTSGMKYFDINVLSTFLKYLPAYFTGAKVLLNNGDKGKIVYIPPVDIINPVVQVRRKFIDLSKEREIRIAAILPRT